MLHILHIVHIYIDNPSQLTFVSAESLIDSDEDVSSTHSLDPMNYSNLDGQDCPDGDSHTSAPPTPTLSIGHRYSIGASCAQRLRGPVSAVLLLYNVHVQEGFTPQGVPFCSLPTIATNIMKKTHARCRNAQDSSW